MANPIEFSNVSLTLEDLPDFKKVELHPINQKYILVLWINLSILFVFFVGLSVAALLMFKDLPWYVFLAGIIFFVVILIFNAVEIVKGFPKRKFGLRELDIIFQKGFFFFSETVIPFKRIQHVEIKQGPLLRTLGLYSLKLYTAGASTGDLVIDGLRLPIAEQLKAKVLQVTEEEDDE